MDELIAAAKAEGMLTIIALPHDWCNYGEMIDTFKAKYGLEVNELNPDAGSGDEIEAIKANKDNKGPQAPDVIDVGFSFGPTVVTEGLVQPYKVSTWDTIPDDAKDPDGNWYGDYYGVLAFEVNSDAVDQRAAGLGRPAQAGVQGPGGAFRRPARLDPGLHERRSPRPWPTAARWTTSMPGLEFFKQLNEAGNFVPVIAKQATVAKGETPVITRWDYNALADKAALEGNPEIEVVIPDTGVVAGVYIQAISAYAPHPNAAKLWMEHLYSDEGQLIWLKGGCHPIRYNDLVARDVIPAELAAALPPAEDYAKAVFPTLEQLNAAAKTIAENWDSMVGADVK